MKKKRAILIIILAVLLLVGGVVCFANSDTLNLTSDKVSSLMEDIEIENNVNLDSETDATILEDNLEDEDYRAQTLADSDHILATNSPYVITTPYGTEADAQYAFSLKWTNDTTVFFWENNDTTSYSGKVIYCGRQQYIFPSSDNLSGKIGCWVYSVGKYMGETVDVKCTFTWTAISIDGVNCYPAIGVQGSTRNNVGI